MIAHKGQFQLDGSQCDHICSYQCQPSIDNYKFVVINVVVRRPISAIPVLNFSLSLFTSLFESLFSKIFNLFLFGTSNPQLADKKDSN